jgi:glucosamine-6-phosphate deaminase
MTMKLIICENVQAAGELIASMLAEAISARPRLNLGLSAGRTSLVAYDELVCRWNRPGGFSFQNLTTFNTDEYVSLSPHDRRSTRFIMNRHLFSQVDVAREQTFIPRGDAADLEAECKAYDLLIEAGGGLDLVVLGLGHNGHIGLNEPGSSPKSRTRLVDLTPSTLAAISGGERFRNLEDTPSRAISMGMATILEARKVWLAATGIGKSEALHRMVEGRVGPGNPSSLLTSHRALTVIVDRDAAAKLDPEHLEGAELR